MDIYTSLNAEESPANSVQPFDKKDKPTGFKMSERAFRNELSLSVQGRKLPLFIDFDKLIKSYVQNLMQGKNSQSSKILQHKQTWNAQYV